MKKFTQINKDKRICVTTDFEEYTDESYFEFEFPDDFDFSVQTHYIIQDNELVYSPPEPDPTTRIAELKVKLTETDYVSSKITDYQVLGIALTSEESERYQDILKQREQWREEIRQLELESCPNSSEDFKDAEDI